MTTATTAAVRLSPPPRRLMRMINPLVRRVLTSRILGPRIGKVAVLQFAGRRTGRTLRIPVILHTIDGVPTVFTSRSWRLNFTGGAPVTVVHRARVHRFRGVLLEAPPQQRGTALRLALDNGASPFELGLTLIRPNPTIADLAAVDLAMIQLHPAEPAATSAERAQTGPTDL
jgi:hypothetical protein